MMAAGVVSTTPNIRFAPPVPLFDSTSFVGQFDVAPDGRFFMLQIPQAVSAAPAPPLTVVLNWFEELKRLAPTK
jgi:hypothetical protein